MRKLCAVPQSWTWVALKDIAEVVTGNTPPTSDLENYGGEIPFFKPPQLNDLSVGSAPEMLSDKGLKKARLLPPKSVLVSCIGILGKTAMTNIASATNQQINAVVFDAPIQPEYGFYYAQTLAPWLKDNSSATTVAIVNKGKFELAPFPLPPVAEQTRIVTKLEELLSALDAGVAELKAAQKKLAQYRQSLLKAAVSGELTAAWREKNPPKETGQQLLQRILRERRSRWETTQLAKFQAQGKAPPSGWKEKYVEPLQPDVSELPQLPKGWTWASGDQLCDLITKGTTPPKEMKAIGEQTIPFLRVTNLTFHGTLDLRDEVFVSQAVHAGFLARSIVFPNDVLMNIVGPPLGQVAVVPDTYSEWNINQAIAIFRPIETVLPNFLCRYLLSNVAQKWFAQRAKTTAGQTNLTLEMCRYLPIPVPPSEEQVAIVDMCEAVLDSCLQQGKAIEASLKQSTAQRKNILQAAFSGQLVPQDPADEPASALLARIRAAREASGKAFKKASSPARKSRRAA